MENLHPRPFWGTVTAGKYQADETYLLLQNFILWNSSDVSFLHSIPLVAWHLWWTDSVLVNSNEIVTGTWVSRTSQGFQAISPFNINIEEIFFNSGRDKWIILSWISSHFSDLGPSSLLLPAYFILDFLLVADRVMSASAIVFFSEPLVFIYPFRAKRKQTRPMPAYAASFDIWDTIFAWGYSFFWPHCIKAYCGVVRIWIRQAKLRISHSPYSASYFSTITSEPSQ